MTAINEQELNRLRFTVESLGLREYWESKDEYDSISDETRDQIVQLIELERLKSARDAAYVARGMQDMNRVDEYIADLNTRIQAIERSEG